MMVTKNDATASYKTKGQSMHSHLAIASGVVFRRLQEGWQHIDCGPGLVANDRGTEVAHLRDE